MRTLSWGMLACLSMACRGMGATDTVDARGGVQTLADGAEVKPGCEPASGAGPRTTWYADGDGDGFGGLERRTVACARPAGHTEDGRDCDDTNAKVHPRAEDAWYDGVDANCDGLDDYDRDRDGDRAMAYGGGDCDDADPTVFGGSGCRAGVDCVHAPVGTLATADPTGVTDLAIDAACNVWVSSTGDGPAVAVFDTKGRLMASYARHGEAEVMALTLDPDGKPVVSHGATPRVAWTSAGAVGEGTGPGTVTVSPYAGLANQSALASDGRCVWAPNFHGDGTLVCVTPTAATTIATLTDRIEAIAFDGADLYVSIGPEVLVVDAATGSARHHAQASADVLDIAVDGDGTLYLETAADTIERVLPNGAGATFAAVSGDGKLAVAPDGWLVRVVPIPNGESRWQEWPLD